MDRYEMKRCDEEAQDRGGVRSFQNHPATMVGCGRAGRGAVCRCGGNPDEPDRLFGMQELVAESAREILGQREHLNIAGQVRKTIVGHGRKSMTKGVVLKAVVTIGALLGFGTAAEVPPWLFPIEK